MSFLCSKGHNLDYNIAPINSVNSSNIEDDFDSKFILAKSFLEIQENIYEASNKFYTLIPL